MISRMCLIPTLAARICALFIFPITAIVCLGEIVVTIINLNPPTLKLQTLVLVLSFLYLVALGAGFFGIIARKIVLLQVILFAIVAYVMMKLFIWITSLNSTNTASEKNVINKFFYGSFVGSVLSFLMALCYVLRLKEIQNDEEY